MGAVVVFALVTALVPTRFAAALTRVHPRLLFTEADVSALQLKVRDGQGFDDQEYLDNQRYADRFLTKTAAEVIDNYGFYGLFSLPSLGMAYHLALGTDENKLRYQSKCKEGLDYLARTYGPVANDSHYSGVRLEVLSLGFDLCFDDRPTGPSDAARQAIVDEILTYLDPVWRNLSIGDNHSWWEREFPPYYNNGSILVGSAVGLASIVLRGETDNTAWLDGALTWAERIIDLNLSAIFDPDGSANEGELYGPFATRFLVPYIEARQRYDGVDLSTRPEVRNYERWLAYAVLPTNMGWTTQANDGNMVLVPMAWNDTYQNWAQTKYGGQLSRWVWQHNSRLYSYDERDRMAAMLWNRGAATEMPNTELPDSTFAQRRGFYYYRTGWPPRNENASADSVFTFYSGKFGGGHAHEDQGTFSLYSRGSWFLRDSGYGNAAKQSEAHNLVFIDDRGEYNAGSSIGTDGSMPAWNLGPFADYLQADLKNAYSTHSPYNDPDQPLPGSNWSWGYEANPNIVSKANRHVVVMKASSEAPEYFAIVDDIDKDGQSHKYDWTFHTETDFTLSTAANPLTITGYVPWWQLKLYFVNPSFSSLSFSNAVYDLQSRDENLLRVKASVPNVVNPLFFVILQPLTDTTPQPTYSTPTGVSGALATRLTWSTVTDDLYFRQGATVTHGTLSSDAALLAVRRTTAGDITKWSLNQGTTLDDASRNLVTVTGGSATVANDGTTVGLSNPALQYSIDGPSVTRVTSNNLPIAFTKSDQTVYVNLPSSLTIDPGTIQATVSAAGSAVVSWTTSQPASGQIEYGRTATYGSTSTLDAALTTSHQQTLTGLEPGRTYHFRLYSRNAAGDDAYSADQTFTIPADTAAPSVVSSLEAR